MALYQLIVTQEIPSSIDSVWEFISSPKNLKEITPDYMGFDITSKNLSEKMYPGMIVTYRVSPILKIKMTWVTEITHMKDKEYFVDEQRVGPYSIWHHQHHIAKIEGGVLMTDIVSYKPPFGFFGRIANKLFIERKLQEIFNFRKIALEKRFGSF